MHPLPACSDPRGCKAPKEKKGGRTAEGNSMRREGKKGRGEKGKEKRNEYFFSWANMAALCRAAKKREGKRGKRT